MCALCEGRGGVVRVNDRWSLSGDVPPLPLSFSLPSGSYILLLSPLQNLTSSVFFFPLHPLLSIFYIILAAV